MGQKLNEIAFTIDGVKYKAIEDMTKQQLGSGIFSDAPIPIEGKLLSNALEKFGLSCCSKNLKNLKGAEWGEGMYLQRQRSSQRQGSGSFLGREGD
jgi:hypothetical protein